MYKFEELSFGLRHWQLESSVYFVVEKKAEIVRSKTVFILS